MKNYDLRTDKSWQKYLSKKQNLSKKTIETYEASIKHYIIANDITFHELIMSQKIEQRSRIEKGIIIEYDADYSTLETYQNNYINYLRSRGNRNTTITLHLQQVATVLRFFNLKSPTLPVFEKDTKKWFMLQKEDIEYVLGFCSTKYRASIRFLLETGMRRNDFNNLTIGDYIKATSYHHKCTELDEFLERANDDMRGYWNYYPNKTKKNKILHKTYNCKTSNKEILLMLRERRAKNPNLTLNDSLFSNSNQNITNVFFLYNKKLKQYKIEQLQQKLDNNIISQETFKNQSKQIPVFHPHALRKYYITSIAMNCSNPRAISLLEGHSNFLRTDNSYVDTNQLEQIVYDEYLKAMPSLTLNQHILTESKIKEQEKELKELRTKTEKLEQYFKEVYDLTH